MFTACAIRCAIRCSSRSTKRNPRSAYIAVDADLVDDETRSRRVLHAPKTKNARSHERPRVIPSERCERSIRASDPIASP
jgi:hypothetical protein